MKSVSAILFVIALFSFTSCKKIDADKGTKEEFIVQVGSFDGILLKGVGEIYYTNDTTASIRVETTQEVFDVMTFTVLTNTLQIGILDNYTIKNSESIKIYISHPMVNRLYLSGSGNIYGDFDSLAYPTLAMDVSGSGNIIANNINCTTMNGTLSGSGAITLTGTTYQSNQTLSGSGNFHLYELYSTNADATISGSGNIWLRADSTLNATISGSGSIFYRSYPTVTTDVSGSGSVIDAN